MKHLFVSMSVKQNLFVSVFVHKGLIVLNDVEYATFKMFDTQISNYLFVIFSIYVLYNIALSFSQALMNRLNFKTGARIFYRTRNILSTRLRNIHIIHSTSFSALCGFC